MFESLVFESLVAARVLHVLGVVLWIGGVAMVTLVLLPALRQSGEGAEQLALFERLEHRFARQARFYTLLTGLSGFAMLQLLDAWGRYADTAFWWVHAMTLTWVVFSVMLFVLEPFVLPRLFAHFAQRNPARAFRLIIRMHWALLALSLITVAGAVAGSHGWRF